MNAPRGRNVAVLPLGRQPQAAALARRFVGQSLVGSGLDELNDDAQLLVSELVTNALLHTSSAVTLRVAVAADIARVEVEDDCPVLPVGGVLDAAAACGRGLVLVERLADAWGADPLPHRGKKVWVELLARQRKAFPELAAEEVLALWDADVSDVDVQGHADSVGAGQPSPERAAGELTRRVRVEGIATDLLNATKSHLDDLVRDLTLATDAAAVRGDRDEEVLALGRRLARLAVDLIGFRNEIRRQALIATRRGAKTLTLELDVPVSLRPRLIDYRDALDLADDLCTADRLLLAPVPAEQAQFRRWKLTTIISQLAAEADGGAET